MAFGFVEDGKLVADGPEIWRRYRRHSLMFDVVTCAPLDLVLYGSGVGPLGVALARFPKALRVVRLGAAARWPFRSAPERVVLVVPQSLQ